MRTFKIYALLEPDEDVVRYVGMTITDLRWRLYAHVKKNKRWKTPRELWVKNLLDQGKLPRIKLIEETESKDDAINLERYWINHYRKISGDLLNVADVGPNGGVVCIGTKHTDEHKKKISDATKGKKVRPETIERIRQYQLNRPKEHTEKIRQSRKECLKTGIRKKVSKYPIEESTPPGSGAI